MLDNLTKRRIDDLRDILVGKIPSPQSQVEQITTGLIYKFMYDMDVEAVEMGGVPSFFIGDYEKYSWRHLFDPKLGGSNKVKLYSEAIEHMYNNPGAPPLFREIFKNSFLPFKDPATLTMFLKGIDEFHYSHSEKLGDAFEYLLSFMGSQGDAGQFRTPRHIIDFIVAIVNPQKNEAILDPACGTAGFLISSYKHILTQNTDKNVGDKLTAEDHKQVGKNLVGYDISPDMTRISLVNMYLHQFASPQIHEYDTLSSEDRWNEYYDVILANPPFFSPKGGIKPHSRFGVRSKRAELLFVDYIMEHLKPDSRAGIIVPEGIIFQTGTAYKTLRKKLIETCLVGVISLPAGVFQPYSGVKTSILVLDKKLNQKSDNVFFAKVENDGFSLGAQRKAIRANDISYLTSLISQYIATQSVSEGLQFSAKEKILQKTDFSLTSPIEQHVSTETEYEYVSITDVASFHRGVTYKKSDEVTQSGFRVLRANNISLDGSLNLTDVKQISKSVKIKEEQWLKTDDLFMCIASGSKEHIGKTHLVTENLECVFGGFMGVLRTSEKILPYYLKSILQNERFNSFLREAIYGANINNIKKDTLKQFQFPLPPIEVQQQIVDELEGYQKIIDGCRQVVENYKPSIDIDPSWEMVELGDMATTEYGTSQKSSKEGKYAVLRMGNLQDGEIDYSDLVYSNEEEDFNKLQLMNGDILFNRTNSPELVGKASIFRGYPKSIIFAGYLVRVKVDERKLLPEYLNAILNSSYGQSLNDRNVSVSGNQANINATKLRDYLIPTPPLDVQGSIVNSIEEERKIVSGNKKLIKTYTQKIQDRISKVWGD